MGVVRGFRGLKLFLRNLLKPRNLEGANRLSSRGFKGPESPFGSLNFKGPFMRHKEYLHGPPVQHLNLPVLPFLFWGEIPFFSFFWRAKWGYGGFSQFVPKCPVLSPFVLLGARNGDRSRQKRTNEEKTGHFGTNWETPPFRIYPIQLSLIFPLRGFPCFQMFERFPFFSRDLSSSAGIKSPFFWVVFLVFFFFSKIKTRKGRIGPHFVRTECCPRILTKSQGWPSDSKWPSACPG